MHSCLQVAEIISCICDMILDYDDIRPAARADINTVASFARTCRAVYAPANHALWGTVNHLAVFVVCTMPKGLWKRVRMPKEFREYQYRLSPTRAIKPEDLERVRFYAPFIHTLQIGLNWSVELAVDGYDSFFQAAGPDLFPNLRALAWNANHVDMGYIKLLLRPTLKNLHFATESLSPGHIDVLREVRQKCPDIERLRYAASQKAAFNVRQVQEFYRIASQFKLVAFSSAFLDEALLPGLLTDGSLRKLAVDVELYSVGSSASNGTPLWNLPPNAFSSLHELVLYCPLTTDTVLHMLQSSSFDALRALTLRPYPLQPDDLTGLIRAIRVALGKSKLLERLDIFEGSRSDWKAVAPTELDEKALKPLLDFKSLTHLVVCGAAGVDITEKMLKRMATAWPNLRTLFIYARTRPYHTISLRVRHLHHLAIRCPKLERLALLVNAEEEPILTEDIPRPDFVHPLRELAVSVAPIEHPDVVADILHTLFPKLESLSWRGSSRNEFWNRRWENVQYDLGIPQVYKKLWAEYLDL